MQDKLPQLPHTNSQMSQITKSALLAIGLLLPVSQSAFAQGPGTSFEGQTLFSPISGTNTYLVSNDGDVMHTWPGNGRSVYLLEDGTLIRTLGDNLGTDVEFVAWDGTVTWAYNASDATHVFHHDVELLPNGNVLMIVREVFTTAEAHAAGRNPAHQLGGSFRPDTIIEVQPTGPNSGTVVWEWRMWDHLIQDFDPAMANYGVVADHPGRLDINFPDVNLDLGNWNHCNAIAYNPALDQIILNSRHQSEFWVIDHSTTTAEAAGHTGGAHGRGGDFIYRWGNPQAYRAGTAADQTLFGQHNTQWIEPGLPGAGNILVFNNGLNRPQGVYSSLDEIVPPLNALGGYSHTTGTAYGPLAALWSYVAPVPTDFYAAFISGIQRLPNGNTLACNGPAGKFFEVTNSMQVVWEYTNPFPDPGNKFVFRARRYRHCFEPQNFCSLSPNSTGPGASMDWSGSVSASANNLVIKVSGAAASIPGLFFFGDDQVQLPFGDGSLCVGGNSRRLPVVFSDPAGSASYALDLSNPALPSSLIGAADTWNFQFWFRDNAFAGTGFNFSDGLQVTFCN